MRRLQYLLALPLAAASLLAQSSAPQAAIQATSQRDAYAPPIFNTTTRNVVLDLVVTDSKGHPVTGLTRNDFVIREDNTPQQTTTLEAVTSGAGAESAPHTILLIDEMNTRFHPDQSGGICCSYRRRDTS